MSINIYVFNKKIVKIALGKISNDVYPKGIEREM